MVITGLEETDLPAPSRALRRGRTRRGAAALYVGITRAMRHLVSPTPWSRTMWGQRADALASRFLRRSQPTCAGHLVLVADAPFDFARRRGSWGAAPTSRRAGPSAPARRRRCVPPGAEKLGLGVGDRVVHDRFGAGVVTKVDGSGAHARAAVDFDEHGTKQLVLAMTPFVVPDLVDLGRLGALDWVLVPVRKCQNGGPWLLVGLPIDLRRRPRFARHPPKGLLDPWVATVRSSWSLATTS